jgi:hypothetical protein
LLREFRGTILAKRLATSTTGNGASLDRALRMRKNIVPDALVVTDPPTRDRVVDYVLPGKFCHLRRL